MTTASCAHLIDGRAAEVPCDTVAGVLLAETGRHWFPELADPWRLHTVLVRADDPSEPIAVALLPSDDGAGWRLDVNFVCHADESRVFETLAAAIGHLRRRALGLEDLGPDPYRAARILHTAGHERLSSWLAELMEWRSTALATEELGVARQRLVLTEAAVDAARHYIDEVFDLVATQCAALDFPRTRTEEIAGKAGAWFEAWRPLDKLRRRAPEKAPQRAPEPGAPTPE